LEYSGVLWEFGDTAVAMILSMGVSNNEIGFRAKQDETVYVWTGMEIES
jgi:hypothetical protein